MDAGFDTIGNATLICYDKKPILVTDPWTVGSAYYGSWTLSHEIPTEQDESINECEFVWVSHGHPDHLSIRSLNRLKEKTILLADHVGGRIDRELTQMGYTVKVIADRQWVPLSPRISVMCIADYNQDAVLLVDIAGTLVVDFNDAGPLGPGPFIQKIVRSYKTSFMLKLFGYGDADMINFLDEDGARIEPAAAQLKPAGIDISRAADAYGFRFVTPFSSLHQYQRSDSVWANQYLTPLNAYGNGFESKNCELLPAFIRYDCVKDDYEELSPAQRIPKIREPEVFKDDWSERLEPAEVEKVNSYFKSVEHIKNDIDFIDVRVGGKSNIVKLDYGKAVKGIEFEVPKTSLMKAVNNETFDDLLIGNFMKTRLVGKWPTSGLYPDFTPWVSKYSDNGGAKTEEQLREYFRQYRNRAPLDYLRHRLLQRLASVARTRVDRKGALFPVLKKVWWMASKRIGT